MAIEDRIRSIRAFGQRSGRRSLWGTLGGVLGLVLLFGSFAFASRPDGKEATPPDSLPIALGATIADAPRDPARLDAFANLVHGMPAIVMWYQAWSEPLFARADMEAVVARGATPMITWEPSDGTNNPNQPSYALRTIADGQHDAYIRRSARLAAAWGKPFFVRFAHEMNGNWAPWGAGVNGNTAAEYIAAWRHVVTIFRQAGATNVIWVWSPNVDDHDRYPFKKFYPGDAWVDWVALDGYNWGNVDPTAGWHSLGAIFGPSYDTLIRLTSKPVMIAETASAESGGNKASWIRQGLLIDVPKRLPRVRAVIWFDDSKETDWRVNSSKAALQAFRAVVASPLYSGKLHVP